MTQMKQIKKILGSSYIYEKKIGEKEILRQQRLKTSSFSDGVAAILTAGCLKIEAVLPRGVSGTELTYDVFVKDEPGSPDWIYYDNITGPASLKETDMFTVLDRIAEQNSLSYTECCFHKLEGKIVNLKEKPPAQQSP